MEALNESVLKTTLCDRSATLPISLKDIDWFAVQFKCLNRSICDKQILGGLLFSRFSIIFKNMFMTRRYIKLLASFQSRAGAAQKNTALPGPLEHLPSQRQVTFALGLSSISPNIGCLSF